MISETKENELLSNVTKLLEKLTRITILQNFDFFPRFLQKLLLVSFIQSIMHHILHIFDLL